MRKFTVHIIAGAALLCVVAVGVRVQIMAVSELETARQARAEGNLARAQTHFLYAARWYLPLVPTSRTAVEELLEVGDTFMELQDFPAAVSAYDDARGALYATAWLASPGGELLERANEGYATALANWKALRRTDVDIEKETERYRTLAASVEVVNPWWSLVMGLSFLSYVVCLGLLAWRFDRKDAKKMPLSVAAGLSFVVWIVAMIML